MIWLVPLFVALHQAWLYNRQGRLDPFSIYSFIDGVVLLILFGGTMSTPAISELAQQDFGFAAMLPAGQLALYVGLHAFGPKRSVKEPVFRTPALFWLYAATVFYLLIAIGIAAVYMNLAGMSLTEWLFGSRNAAYSLGKSVGIGSILNNVFTACQVGVLILLTVALKQKRYGMALIIYGALFFGLFLIFTTRFQLIIILAIPIVAYHYYVKRIGVFALSSMAIGLIGLAAFLNLWRGGGIEHASEGVSFENVVKLSSVGESSYLVEPVGLLYSSLRDKDIEYEYGANYAYSLVTFVPRALWKGKPLTAFENRMTVKMFGSQLDTLGFANIWTFTAWGEGFAQFDVAGVILNLFLYGLLVATSYRYCLRRPELALVWIYYSFLAAVYLRAGFQALFILTLNMIVVAAIFEALPRIRALTQRAVPDGTV